MTRADRKSIWQVGVKEPTANLEQSPKQKYQAEMSWYGEVTGGRKFLSWKTGPAAPLFLGK